MYRFLPLNLNSYTYRLTEPTFGAKITTFEKFQFHIWFKTIEKKQALLWALQFQFNCRRYSIKKLSSFKLPMDSQCIQDSSLKGIFVPNVNGGFHIYITRQSATLTVQMLFCVAIWIYMSLLTYLNSNSSSKILVLQLLLGFMLVCCSEKVKW